jgi:hypothetical protein
VQITEQKISSEGVLLLAPLLDCEDATVREGVRAYLAARYAQQEALRQRRVKEGWTSFQCADHLLLQQLRGLDMELAPYRDPELRWQAYDAFRRYAYQWY